MCVSGFHCVLAKPPWFKTIGFRNLVGTAIAPFSKKLTVKKWLACMDFYGQLPSRFHYFLFCLWKPKGPSISDFNLILSLFYSNLSELSPDFIQGCRKMVFSNFSYRFLNPTIFFFPIWIIIVLFLRPEKPPGTS